VEYTSVGRIFFLPLFARALFLNIKQTYGAKLVVGIKRICKILGAFRLAEALLIGGGIANVLHSQTGQIGEGPFTNRVVQQTARIAHDTHAALCL
jgi:hypothetical protein